MRRRKPSPIHDHRKVEFILTHVSPVRYYMEEELTVEEVSEKLMDTDGEHFFNLFKQYNRNFFSYGSFHGLYYYERYFSSMFLFFNDTFYNQYKPGCYYALQMSVHGLYTLLIKEHYPNETEYLKTVAYLDNLVSCFKEGSLLLEFVI